MKARCFWEWGTRRFRWLAFKAGRPRSSSNPSSGKMNSKAIDCGWESDQEYVWCFFQARLKPRTIPFSTSRVFLPRVTALVPCRAESRFAPFPQKGPRTFSHETCHLHCISRAVVFYSTDRTDRPGSQRHSRRHSHRAGTQGSIRKPDQDSTTHSRRGRGRPHCAKGTRRADPERGEAPGR